MTDIFTIPEKITVHLGPPNEPAKNVSMQFPLYIKSVTSSEIYPTWPESALRANIYAIISFTLNRIYTKWYRSQGYDFDITSSPQYDQAFVYGRAVFINISNIVDDIFNDYIQKQGTNGPYLAEYCNGTSQTCTGLSQWGSVELADDGMIAYDILKYYYGNDINIVENAPVIINMPLYPGNPLALKSTGDNVSEVQKRLNRIAENYIVIPVIPKIDGIYGKETESAVIAFQEIFLIPRTGVVDKGTWYRIGFVYTAIKRLSSLDSEGIREYDEFRDLPEVQKLGDRGPEVRVLQYFISLFSKFNSNVPPIKIDSVFGPETEEAVKAIQRIYGLPDNGIVDERLWKRIYSFYQKLISVIDIRYLEEEDSFPEKPLQEGSTGFYVLLLQKYLDEIAKQYPSVSAPPAIGLIGPVTKGSIIEFQKLVGRDPNGIVDSLLWNDIVKLYAEIIKNK